MATSKGNPEWLAMTKIDPEFKQALARGEVPPASMVKDIYTLRAGMQARKAERDAAAALQASSDSDSSNTFEKDIEIPMRDGFKNRARVYVPKAADASRRSKTERPLVMMIHGGGWCMGALEGEDAECRHFAKEYGCVCVSIEYRLAPEHPFPTGPNDAWDAVKWIAANASHLGADPSSGFIVGGSSAGGNMAAVISLLARDQKLSPPLTGLLLLIPSCMNWKNIPSKYASEIASYEQCREAPILNEKSMELFMSNYQPDPASQLHNIFAPLHTSISNPSPTDPDLKNLPPAFLQVCGWDPTRDEALVFERLLRENGTKTKLIVYPGLPHGFASFLPHLKVSEKFRKDTVDGMGWLLEQNAKR